MFEQVSLIIKPDNQLILPDYTWTRKSHIHCNCTLHYGLGDKKVWSGLQSIPLTKLIHFYNKLVSGDNEYSFKHGDTVINFFWITQEIGKVQLTIRETWWKETKTTLQITLDRYRLSDYRYQFFMPVLEILLKHTSEEVCTHYGELFFGGQTRQTPALKIGQYAETVIGENVKRFRTGYIINRYYHDKRKTYIYFLLINDKPYPRWYFEHELQAVTY